MTMLSIPTHPNDSMQALKARDAVLNAVSAKPGISLTAVHEKLVSVGYRYCDAQTATWDLLNDRRGITGRGAFLYPIAA
jgi:hypothetical protein